MQENDFTYQLFTISELEDWLFHNVENGLSDKVIARPRALAFVRNPHAKPDDPALVVVYNENKEPVGYTGAFAEQWIRPSMPERYYWGSTQWMDPQYRGKGVSGKMMRMIKDAVGDKYVALDSSAASCRLDEKQGSVISYYPRYYFVFPERKGNAKSLKALVKGFFVNKANKKALKCMNKYNYKNRYVNWIDHETYAFIVSHSDKDLFLRQQDYLNWQLRHPFLIATGDDTSVELESCEFGGCVKRVEVQMVQVLVDGKLCGFYALNLVDNRCTPLYLYYEESKKEQVFASLMSNVLRDDTIWRFRTFNKELFEFSKRQGVRGMFSKNYVEQISLTVPGGFAVDASLHLQGGDGDMVC